MLAPITNIFADFISLLFPQECLACQELLARGEKSVCTECRINLPYTNSHLLFNSDNGLLQRFYNKVPVKYAFAYLYFNRSGRVQKLLHALKYKGHEEVGETLGNWYGAELKENNYHQQFDVIIPVPLHTKKLKKRGYNQSDSFAKGLAQMLEVNWQPHILKRTADTSTQTKKTRLERWQNVGQLFTVADPASIQNKRILLVDDVMTTGATLEACALVLLEAGAQEVSVAAIAAA
ncbi:ComF family protein [Adhaeribacter pallidiroseus]|uniref:Amidophosphoribosyltransferase n=1 Tax=Adhaeribacter pallidiroseus TaxID=2072847 RepID=A0A369QS91_9BACT|nr:ComF family protein [Adhaeribacter pallidiroseus]RDC65679.1 Amidophosphoribosyltransferase [Adhaeribacter pallidiroseus]